VVFKSPPTAKKHKIQKHQDPGGAQVWRTFGIR